MGRSPLSTDPDMSGVAICKRVFVCCLFWQKSLVCGKTFAFVMLGTDKKGREAICRGGIRGWGGGGV